MRLLLDENCSGAALVALLQAYGHDVETTVDALGFGAIDEAIAHHAINTERALVTKDVGDFRSLYDQRGQHSGVLLIYEGTDGERMSAAALAMAVNNVAKTYPSVCGFVLALNEFIW